MGLQVLVDRFAESRNEGLTSELSELSGREHWEAPSHASEDVSPLELAHLFTMLQENPSASEADALQQVISIKDVCRSKTNTDITAMGLKSDDPIGYGQFKRLLELLSATMVLEEQQILAHFAWVEIGKFDLTDHLGMVIMQRIFLRTGPDALHQKIQSNDFMRMCHVFKLTDNSGKRASRTRRPA